eukprot:765676-Hanusia_phi.AAC.3
MQPWKRPGRFRFSGFCLSPQAHTGVTLITESDFNCPRLMNPNEAAGAVDPRRPDMRRIYAERSGDRAGAMAVIARPVVSKSILAARPSNSA